MKQVAVIITALLLSACDTYELRVAAIEHYEIMVCEGSWEEWKDEPVNCNEQGSK